MSSFPISESIFQTFLFANDGDAAYPLCDATIDQVDYIPLRLTFEERKRLRLVRAAVAACDYTDKVDVANLQPQKRLQRILLELQNLMLGVYVADAGVQAGAPMCRKGAMDISKTEALIRTLFELTRRYKVMNPEMMRCDYGKFLHIIQDSVQADVAEMLGFHAMKKIVTVGDEAVRLGCEDLLTDPDLALATTPVPRLQPISALNAALRKKDLTVKRLIETYARPSPRGRDDVERLIRSIDDANCYIRDGSATIEQMIELLTTYFDPQSAEPGLALAISEGIDGARLSHAHEKQYHYVLQTLTLWKNITRYMYKLWLIMEQDFLTAEHPYSLEDTGQGLHRQQKTPTLYTAVQQLVDMTKAEVEVWIGSDKVHMGDHQVPNGYAFIDKYTQTPRIIVPLIKTLLAINTIVKDPEHAAFVKEMWATPDQLRKAILCDFFKHGFDGSGGENDMDAGSCIDGRLTSAWNWCNTIKSKSFYPIFLLAGFASFDGAFEVIASAMAGAFYEDQPIEVAYAGGWYRATVKSVNPETDTLDADWGDGTYASGLRPSEVRAYLSTTATTPVPPPPAMETTTTTSATPAPAHPPSALKSPRSASASEAERKHVRVESSPGRAIVMPGNTITATTTTSTVAAAATSTTFSKRSASASAASGGATATTTVDAAAASAMHQHSSASAATAVYRGGVVEAAHAVSTAASSKQTTTRSTTTTTTTTVAARPRTTANADGLHAGELALPVSPRSPTAMGSTAALPRLTLAESLFRSIGLRCGYCTVVNLPESEVVAAFSQDAVRALEVFRSTIHPLARWENEVITPQRWMAWMQGCGSSTVKWLQTYLTRTPMALSDVPPASAVGPATTAAGSIPVDGELLKSPTQQQLQPLQLMTAKEALNAVLASPDVAVRTATASTVAESQPLSSSLLSPLSSRSRYISPPPTWDADPEQERAAAVNGAMTRAALQASAAAAATPAPPLRSGTASTVDTLESVSAPSKASGGGTPVRMGRVGGAHMSRAFAPGVPSPVRGATPSIGRGSHPADPPTTRATRYASPHRPRATLPQAVGVVAGGRVTASPRGPGLHRTGAASPRHQHAAHVSSAAGTPSRQRPLASSASSATTRPHTAVARTASPMTASTSTRVPRALPSAVCITGITRRFKCDLNGRYVRTAKGLDEVEVKYARDGGGAVLYKSDGRWRVNDSNNPVGWVYSNATLAGQWVVDPGAGDYTGAVGTPYPFVTVLHDVGERGRAGCDAGSLPRASTSLPRRAAAGRGYSASRVASPTAHLRPRSGSRNASPHARLNSSPAKRSTTGSDGSGAFRGSPLRRASGPMSYTASRLPDTRKPATDAYYTIPSAFRRRQTSGTGRSCSFGIGDRFKSASGGRV